MLELTLRTSPILLLVGACVSSLSPLPKPVPSTPPAGRIGSVTYAAQVAVSPTARVRGAIGGVRVEAVEGGQVLVAGDKRLTPPLAAIESFDVSADRGEVAFSARREGGFDIGLVALEGSDIRWMPSDPADELGVQWAPRGHKISYIIRGKGGDYIRTLHIPTSFEYTLDFPGSRVKDLAWDAPAERFAVVLESMVASDRVEVTHYNGEGRRVAVEPAVRLDVATEPVAGGLLMRPASMRYNETLPLVIWVTEGDLHRWDDDMGALMRSARVAMAVVPERPEEVWRGLSGTPWIDRQRVFIVDPTGRAGPPVPAWTITGDPSIPAGYYRRGEESITLRPGDVKSFAAGFIADQLKGPDVITRHR